MKKHFIIWRARLEGKFQISSYSFLNWYMRIKRRDNENKITKNAFLITINIQIPLQTSKEGVNVMSHSLCFSLVQALPGMTLNSEHWEGKSCLGAAQAGQAACPWAPVPAWGGPNSCMVFPYLHHTRATGGNQPQICHKMANERPTSALLPCWQKQLRY